MDTKRLSAIIIFSALTISLNPYFSRMMIPTFYFGAANYTFMEIPIIASLLIFGPLVGIAVGLLGGLSLIFYFPSFYNVPLTTLAIVVTELGVYLAYWLVKRKVTGDNLPSWKKMIVYTNNIRNHFPSRNNGNCSLSFRSIFNRLFYWDKFVRPTSNFINSIMGYFLWNRNALYHSNRLLYR